jgi:hypothetical protein
MSKVERTEEFKAKHREYQEKYRKKNPLLVMCKAAKHRAKLKGLEFNIKPSDIVLPKYCPVFPEIELIRNDGVHKDNSPSLDRIDNNKGYVKGNVKVISNKANILKGDGSIEDLERIIVYMKSSLQEKN